MGVENVVASDVKASRQVRGLETPGLNLRLKYAAAIIPHTLVQQLTHSLIDLFIHPLTQMLDSGPWVYLDVTDKDSMARIAMEHGVTHVVHLATLLSGALSVGCWQVVAGAWKVSIHALLILRQGAWHGTSRASHASHRAGSAAGAELCHGHALMLRSRGRAQPPASTEGQHCG